VANEVDTCYQCKDICIFVFFVFLTCTVLVQYFFWKTTVMNTLVMLNSILLEFLRYLQPFLRYCKIHKIIFNSEHNSAQQILGY
jgi:hypothetical protein